MDGSNCFFKGWIFPASRSGFYQYIAWLWLVEIKMIVIIDYGMGNLGSIANMLKHIGVQALVSADPEQIEHADKLILAGVGAFDAGMQRLKDLELIPLLKNRALDHHTPFLGICLGMQLLTHCSEEGQLPGLGWFEAETIKFNFEGQATRLRVPHMGWNEIQARTQHPLLGDLRRGTTLLFCTFIPCALPLP
jgi:glutamine amidotransferase